MHHISVRVLGALAALTLGTPAFAQPVSDHLACYRVKDSRARGRARLTVTNAGVTQSCAVKLPAVLGCLETQKSNVVPAPPGGGPPPESAGNFLCYRLKCPRPLPPDFRMTDQFGGERAVDFRGAQLVCAPAIRGAQTSVTTTTLAPAGCRFSDGRCQGTCSNGGRCGATVSGTSCECRTTPCGDADSPECEGFCTDTGEACVFNLSGCSCVRIP